MYNLVFTESFKKKELRFLKKHTELVDTYAKILKLLSLNPQHPSLRTHKLAGKLSGLFSVAITISYRLTVHFIIKDKIIIPINIGSHDEVY